MKGARVMIVLSRYYAEITNELEAGAIEALEAAEAEVTVREVPGALEIPTAIAIAADTGMYDAYVALGCVIRGETSHYDYVCGESARGLMDLGLQRRLAIGNGILTVENQDQALARARRSEKNKGKDAAEAALALVAFRKDLLRG